MPFDSGTYRARRALAGLLLFVAAALAGAAELTPEKIMAAVVDVQAEIREDARTAEILGTSRSGSGVVIGEGDLVLTIGYLIMESTSVTVSDRDGEAVPARVVAYHNESGLGLVRAQRDLGIAPIEFGNSAALNKGDPVLVVSRNGGGRPTPARVVARRAFAGSWEYLLEDAIFTAPPHTYFGGAALIDDRGRLVGVGSLRVDDAETDGLAGSPGNMFVPVDLLESVLDDLVATGRSPQPRRPWIGVYTEIFRGHLMVTHLADEGPAQGADIRPGDIVLRVNGQGVADMADFLRKVWALGEAGVAVPLTLVRAGELHQVTIDSTDQYQWLKLSSDDSVTL